MALKIGTTEPTEIKFIKNGTTTDLTVLKCGTTAVWGKPYSFIANGSDCTITASRTSSPNEHASTGDALTTGSKIYHGDVIQITVLPTTIQYQVTDVTINGVAQTVTGGTFETTLTVTGSINVNAAAGRTSKTWQTKFSGSKASSFSYSLENDPITQNFPTSDWDYINIPLSAYNVTLSATENPIRITGTLKVTTKSSSTSNSATTTLTANELTTSWTKKTNDVSITVSNNKLSASSSAWLRAETSNLGLRIDVHKARNLTVATGTVVLTVTKVEQYLTGGTATKLSVPSITGHSWLNENMKIRLTVANNNSVAAVFHGTLYDTAYDDAYGSISITIGANSTKTVDIALDSSFGEGVGCYVQAYFTADGYNQSSTIKYVAEQ